MQTKRSHNTYRRISLPVCAALIMLAIITPCAQAQVGGVTTVPDEPNVPDNGLALGHVPDLDDLTPKERDYQRAGFVPRGGAVSASDWMNQSIRSMKAEAYTEAAEGFRRAASIYAEKGQSQDALIMSTYAARCESRVGLFYERAPHIEMLRQKMTTGRRLEPVYGAYVGAFIDHEQGVDASFSDEDQSSGRSHRDVAEFDQKIGKKHAAFFTYCGYKSGLPDKWFANLRENGAAAQWAIEPDSLEEVQDDDWLRGMAHAAADSGVPVFIRFASEMNGDWTPYHTPPALYREKFQLVARVFHRIAPNAAMVWCPNEIPQSNIADYYPGDDAVDWVGVNFYSVYYNNGDASRPVSWCNPADKLDYVYQHYASKHPIMICEWAATHHEIADGLDRSAFATEKIAQLYSSLPRRYPRIKAVFWLDMNAIEYANDPKTRKNDYSLLSAPTVAAAYRRMVSAPYFLESFSGNAMASREIAALTDRTPLSGAVTLSAYVKIYEETPTVVWSVNGHTVQTLTDPGAYEYTLNTASLPNGPAKISVTVLDHKGRVAVKQTETVVIQNDRRTGSAGASSAPAAAQTAPASAPPPAAPVVIAPPAPGAVLTSLGDALTAARAGGGAADGALSLDMTPANGTVFLGPGVDNGIRVTATVSASAPATASPTLVLLLLHGATDDATVEVLAPTATTEASLADLAVVPGASVAVPKSPNRVLSPDAIGSYTVRAILLPSKETARAMLQMLTGIAPPPWKHLVAALRGTLLPAGSHVSIADRTVEVVAR